MVDPQHFEGCYEGGEADFTCHIERLMIFRIDVGMATRKVKLPAHKEGLPGKEMFFSMRSSTPPKGRGLWDALPVKGGRG